jgi:hypothetical protein
MNKTNLIKGQKITAVLYNGPSKVEATALCAFLKTNFYNITPMPLTGSNLYVRLHKGTTLNLPGAIDGFYIIKMEGVIV